MTCASPRERGRAARVVRVVVQAAAAALAACARGAVAAPTSVTPVPVAAPVATPAREYHAFVVSESADLVAVVRLGPEGLSVERQVKVGLAPTEINGPHGVSVSPDGRYYYVSIAHGTPYGSLWKFTTVGDTLKGRTTLGFFPASVQVTPDGAFAYVVNFNLYGDMVPSSVSVVATDEMMEVARITTCTMPHGSRVNPQGTRQYSTCMMDDELVEIDTRTLAASRHFRVAKGSEGGETGAPHAHGAHDPACSPTWAQPSADGARVFVACNKSNEIVEVDAARWSLVRRLPAGDGVYNLAASADGRVLVATNKRAASVSVFDAASGRELARLPTKRRVPHGVTITPDGRYALVTEEGVGSEPGTVEAFDLTALRGVGAVDVGQQAAGIDFWRATERD